MGRILRHGRGILEKVIEYPAGTKVEKTLVLIKPDNFKFPNLRPGGVIEVFRARALTSLDSRFTA